MDTSETYIKMRLAAIPDLGMGISPTKSAPCFFTDTVWVDAVGNWYCIGGNVIGCQLERQDQLQDIVMEHWWGDEQPGNRISAMLQNFNWWLNDMLPSGSMEQLWLAFYMSVKYNKQWDGENWIKKGGDIG